MRSIHGGYNGEGKNDKQNGLGVFVKFGEKLEETEKFRGSGKMIKSVEGEKLR